jgi:hypothetical protein
VSYDLAVFDPAIAPRERAAFIDWYRHQTEWSESHGYNNPDVSSASLRAWFQEMIATYPPMNGPLASDDPDDPKVTDYSVGRAIIYAAFAWSEAEHVLKHMKALATQHGVGFVDVSSDAFAVLWPDNAKPTKMRAARAKPLKPKSKTKVTTSEKNAKAKPSRARSSKAGVRRSARVRR